jgi:hypothetical protein
MGLESINLFFHANEQIENVVAASGDFIYIENRKYVYKRDNDFWIDIEFQDLNSLSIRIALCNPTNSLLNGLNSLLLLLFKFKGSKLMVMNTNRIFKEYNDEVRNALELSYINRKKVFESIYGNFTAALGSEEFYKYNEQKNKFKKE